MDILEKEKCIQIQRELIDKIQIKNIVEKDEIKTMDVNIHFHQIYRYLDLSATFF